MTATYNIQWGLLTETGALDTNFVDKSRKMRSVAMRTLQTGILYFQGRAQTSLPAR